MNALELSNGERWIQRVVAGSLVALAVGLVAVGLALYA